MLELSVSGGYSGGNVCEEGGWDSLGPAVTGVNLTLDPSVIVLALMEAGTC